MLQGVFSVSTPLCLIVDANYVNEWLSFLSFLSAACLSYLSNLSWCQLWSLVFVDNVGAMFMTERCQRPYQCIQERRFNTIHINITFKFLHEVISDYDIIRFILIWKRNIWIIYLWLLSIISFSFEFEGRDVLDRYEYLYTLCYFRWKSTPWKQQTVECRSCHVQGKHT